MRKKNFWNLLTCVMAVAMLSVGFSSCGSDNDDDNASGGGSASTGSSGTGVSLGGKTVSVSNGYYSYEGEWILTFTNYDLYNMTAATLPSSINYLSINITDTEQGSGVPVGEFTKFHVYIVNGATPQGSSGEQYEGSAGYSNGANPNARLTINKNGDVYTITYTGLTVDDDKNSIENTSFSWTGKLREARNLH